MEPSYYEQSTADSLPLNQTVFEAVQSAAPPEYSATEIRTLLAQFMFKGDEIDKKLIYLSGGEKARVALCRMMLRPANLLLLDEPTNHLDISSKEVLEDALRHYDGSVVVISHDRYFMSQIAQQIFAFQNATVVKYGECRSMLFSCCGCCTVIVFAVIEMVGLLRVFLFLILILLCGADNLFLQCTC